MTYAIKLKDSPNALFVTENGRVDCFPYKPGPLGYPFMYCLELPERVTGAAEDFGVEIQYPVMFDLVTPVDLVGKI